MTSLSTAPTVHVTLSEMEWETALLHRKIGRVEGADAIVDASDGVETIEAVERHALVSGFSLLVSRVAIDRTAAVWSLERSGFVTADVGLTFEYDRATLPAVRPARDSGPAIVRAATDDDLPALHELVGGLFLHSYYYAGALFSRAEADLLYRAWVTNSVHGRADRVLLVTRGHEVLGFITCRVAADRTGIIELVGVDRRHGSQGLGKALVLAALHCFHELHAATVRVRTQASNLAAARLYGATGGRLVSVDTTLLKSLSGRRS